MNTSPRAGSRLVARALTLTAALALTHAAEADAIDRSPRAHRVARAAPVLRLAQSVRRQRVLDAFARGGHVQRCWTRQLMRDPTSASRTLHARLVVSADGRVVTVDVRDPMAPSLAACIATGAITIPTVGPGEAFTADTTISLERGE